MGMWSMVFMGCTIIISAVFLCFALEPSMTDETINHADRLWLNKYYGDAVRSSYTLFEVTMAGCWPNYFRPLIEKVSPWFCLFVVPYIAIVAFAMLRIISALFLKQTLDAAQ